MADDKKRKTVSRSEKIRDPRAVRRFLEELSWLLETHSGLDFKLLADSVEPTSPAPSLTRHAPRNPNIQFLVGALPTIFSDDRFFPTNEDLAEFANQALNLPVPRWEKRSRYELIGLIVCETVKLNDERLARLVAALTRVTADDITAQEIMKGRKEFKLSWNEVIQRLTHGG